MKFATPLCAVLCLLGCFMPMASCGPYFVEVSHIGGVALILYLLATAGIVHSILSIYRPGLPYLSFWGVGLGLSGLVLTFLAVSSGKSQLLFMTSITGQLGGFSFDAASTPQSVQGDPSFGTGAMMSALGYVGIMVLSLKAALRPTASQEN